jgi:alkylhydroperoxidase/carboxymuconolactone decarboxylase family protein YurZ
MTCSNKIEDYLNSLRLSKSDAQFRLISIFSAAIALSRPRMTAAIMIYLKKHGVGKNEIYEAILQSYLMLGFPRAIEAAMIFEKVFGELKSRKRITEISLREAREWFNKGNSLCRRIYGRNFDSLRNRFVRMSPELFRWILIEAYGKVLSRKGMMQIERELAEVAILIVERRERQLVSHILGSLNVGASFKQLRQVNNDILPLSGMKSFRLGEKLISRIENKYAAAK